MDTKKKKKNRETKCTELFVYGTCVAHKSSPAMAAITKLSSSMGFHCCTNTAIAVYVTMRYPSALRHPRNSRTNYPAQILSKDELHPYTNCVCVVVAWRIWDLQVKTINILKCNFKLNTWSFLHMHTPHSHRNWRHEANGLGLKLKIMWSVKITNQTVFHYKSCKSKIQFVQKLVRPFAGAIK